VFYYHFMHTVYLIIGGNIGNREDYLSQARRLISQQVGEIVSSSDIFESEPWGFDHHVAFLNQVLEVRTTLSALCMFDICQEIEKSLGRDMLTSGYRPRTIDIDVLFFDDCIFTLPPLIVPHKLMHKRMFVLEPLAQIAPHFTHPIFGLSIADLREACTDPLKVWRFEKVAEQV